MLTCHPCYCLCVGQVQLQTLRLDVHAQKRLHMN